MTPVKAMVLSCSGMYGAEMAGCAGLGLGERHHLQLWQEHLPSCWPGTSDTLLTQSGTSVVTKGAAPVLAGHWVCLGLGLEGHW